MAPHQDRVQQQQQWQKQVVVAVCVTAAVAPLAPPPVPCRVPLLAAHLMLLTHQLTGAAGALSGPTHPPLLKMSWMR
jgi:L-fucose isomerase-like protein